MDTIWLLTTLLVNGHVLQSVTMDQHTCRKAEMYAAMSKPFQVKSDHGPIPVVGASCIRFTASCPYTGQQLAMVETK